MMRGLWSLVVLASIAVSHVGANASSFPSLQVIPPAATTRAGHVLGSVGIVGLEVANQTLTAATTTSSSSSSSVYYPPPTPITTLTGIVSTCTVPTTTQSAAAASTGIVGRFHDRKIRRAARPAVVAAAPFPRDAAAPGQVEEGNYFPVANLTWGCPAGTNCNPPKQAGCNVYNNPPPSDYVCAPEYCQDVTAFVVNEWPANTTGYYQLTEGYFNLNPNEFGLSFDIFSTETETTGGADENAAPEKRAAGIWQRITTVQARQDSSLDPSQLPSFCFTQCNNAFNEAQMVGKQTDLCQTGSAFRNDYNGCQDCIANNADPTLATERSYIDNQFAQYLTYCESIDPTGPSTATPVSPASEVSSTASLTTTDQASGTSLSDIILTPSSTASSTASTLTNSSATSAPSTTGSSDTSSTTFTSAASSTEAASSSEGESTTSSSGSSTGSATSSAAAIGASATPSSTTPSNATGTGSGTGPSSTIVQAGSTRTINPLGIMFSVVSGLGLLLLVL